MMLYQQLDSIVERGDHPEEVVAQLQSSWLQYYGLRNSDKVALLLQAARLNRLEILRSLLEFWKSTNELHLLINTEYPRSNETALRWAALVDSVDAVQLLLDNGADVNEQERYELTLATTHFKYLGMDERPETLQKAPHLEQATGRTSLYWSCLANNSAVVETLVKNGASVNVSDQFGWTPLMWTAYHGNFRSTRLLLCSGANANARVSNGPQTVGIELTRRVPPHVFRFLQSVLFDRQNMCIFERWTPLWFAVRLGSVEIVELLLTQGANPNLRDFDGRSLLCWMMNYQFFPTGYRTEEILDLLILHGADVNAISRMGLSPLRGATGRGSMKLVNHLMANGAIVVPDCFLVAVQVGNIPLAKLYIAHGVNVNIFDGTSTPLGEACRVGDIAMIDLLLKHGADVNQLQRNVRMRPLCQACLSDDVATSRIKSIVALLLEHGADASLPSMAQVGGTYLGKTKTPLEVMLMESNRLNYSKIRPADLHQVQRRVVALREVVAMLMLQQFAFLFRNSDDTYFSCLNHDEPTGEALLEKIGRYLVGDDAIPVLHSKH